MAQLASSPIPLVFDGRGYGLSNCIVTHRPGSTSAASITVYGTDANGDIRATELVSSRNLSTNANGNGIYVDVIQLPPDPLLAVWYVIDDCERIADLISVQFTAAIPAEAIAT